MDKLFGAVHDHTAALGSVTKLVSVRRHACNARESEVKGVKMTTGERSRRSADSQLPVSVSVTTELADWREIS